MNNVENKFQHWVPQRRIPALDALRGVAALAVVVHHSSLQRLSIARIADYNPRENIWHPLLFWLGGWGVTLFFIISGFCIHLPQARNKHDGLPFIGWKQFYRRRFRRLIPTHYASIILACLVAFVLPGNLLTKPTPGTFIAHLFMVHTFISIAYYYSINAVFWSIAIEVHFYMTYPVLQLIRRRIETNFVIILLCLGFVVFIIGSMLESPNMRFVVRNSFVVTWWQWGLGVMLAEIYVRGYFSKMGQLFISKKSVWLWGVVSLLLAYLDPSLHGLHIRPWIFPFTCTYLLLSAIIYDRKSKMTSILAWLGKFSYSMYLAHPMALAVCLWLIPLRVFPGSILIVIDVVASVGISYVFFYLVERNFISGSASKNLLT